MGPLQTTSTLLSSVVIFMATVARAQNVHSGVVAFRPDQYRSLRHAPQYDAQQLQPALQQYPQPGLPQGPTGYQVSGAVQQPQQYAQSSGFNQGASYPMQPPQGPISPFLPQQQGQYALAGQQPQQQYQQQPQQPQQYMQQQPLYQRPLLSPAAPNPFYGVQQPQPQQQFGGYPQQQQQQQQGYPQLQAYPQQQQPQYAAYPQQGYPQQQQQQPQGAYPQQQFQAQPIFAQQPQQQQAYPQPLPAAPLAQQQQAYAQPLPMPPQYLAQQQAAPQRVQQLPTVVASQQVIAPPPRIQQLPAQISRPAPPPAQQLLRVEPLQQVQQQSQTAPPPPARFTPHSQDVHDPSAAISATGRPSLVTPPPPAVVETATVITVGAQSEQVVESRVRAEPDTPVQRLQKLRNQKKIGKRKRVKVISAPVEPQQTITVTSLPPVAETTLRAKTHRQRIITATAPPAFAPPTVTAARQLRVRPSTVPPPPPPEITTTNAPAPPPMKVHRPSKRPSKLVELTTAASKATPNDVFLQCCRETGIDAKCHSRCNFDTLTKKVLTGMFLGTDPCPQKNGKKMLECAAQHNDHTQCCLDRGVDTTAAKNKCLGFCVMTPGSSFAADISMLPCWAVLNDIKGCFKDAILDN